MGMVSFLKRWLFNQRNHNPVTIHCEFGICPECNGSGRIQCPSKSKINWQSNGWYDYDPITNTIACPNCGDQYQYSRPTGIVNLNREGKPCQHQYISELLSQYIQRNECIHCGDEFYINLQDLQISEN